MIPLLVSDIVACIVAYLSKHDALCTFIRCGKITRRYDQGYVVNERIDMKVCEIPKHSHLRFSNLLITDKNDAPKTFIDVKIGKHCKELMIDLYSPYSRIPALSIPHGVETLIIDRHPHDESKFDYVIPSSVKKLVLAGYITNLEWIPESVTKLQMSCRSNHDQVHLNQVPKNVTELYLASGFENHRTKEIGPNIKVLKVRDFDYDFNSCPLTLEEIYINVKDGAYYSSAMSEVNMENLRIPAHIKRLFLNDVETELELEPVRKRIKRSK